MNDIEIAVLGGGCFWCLEAVYQQLKGIQSVASGYAGGTLANPSYKEVCSETTGHAEVVELKFDPRVISFRELLEVFFTIHDPTTINRQGNDVGTQYRSVVMYTSEQQNQVTQEVIDDLTRQKLWNAPIVTELKQLDQFYIAEDYHQNYYNNNSNQMYCRALISPKVVKVRAKFLDKLIKA